MNNKIKEFAGQAGIHFHKGGTLDAGSDGIARFVLYSDMEKFAELIIAELRGALIKEYLDTPLECCGHFLRLDEAILDHFYGLDDAPKT